MQYGIPYMGSKSKIMPSIALNFPSAEHFYDLFGGGFSVTHYMLTHHKHKFKHFHYNEIEPSTVELVKKAINGDYNYDKFKPPWISREEFFARKDTDAYVRLLWSFGNNQTDYLFGEDIEEYKRTMHNAVVFNEFNKLAIDALGIDKWPKNVTTIYHKRCYIRQKMDWYNKNKKIPKVLYKFLSEKQLKEMGKKDNAQQLEQLQQVDQLMMMQQLQRLERLQQLQQLERLERLQQLQQLERLQQLQRLEQVERLNCYSTSYENVPILPNSVVYCDIPYENTEGYLREFDRKSFLDWAASRPFPVFISEYNISDSRFKLKYTIDKLSLMDNTKETKTIMQEKLYWNGK